MSEDKTVEFALRAVLYADGRPLDPLRFYGDQSGNIFFGRMKVLDELLETEPEQTLEAVITDLCDVLRLELLRVFAGKREGP